MRFGLIGQIQEKNKTCNQDFMSIIWYRFSQGHRGLHTTHVLVQVHVHSFLNDGQLLILDKEVNVLDDLGIICVYY